MDNKGKSREEVKLENGAKLVINESDASRHLVEKDCVLDLHLEYVKASQEEREKRAAQMRTKEQRERALEEQKAKEKEIFRGNARDFYDLLAGTFFIHRRINPKGLKKRNAVEFVISKCQQSVPGELQARVRDNELVLKPWNHSELELRFVAPPCTTASRVPAYIKKNTTTTGSMASKNIRGRFGNNKNYPYKVRIAPNKFVDSRVYGGARLHANSINKNLLNTNVKEGGVNPTKEFPDNRTARDYPLEVNYTGPSRTPTIVKLEPNLGECGGLRPRQFTSLSPNLKKQKTPRSRKK